MLKFSLAINWLLDEYSIGDRIKIAADAGYDGVDIYGDHEGIDPDEVRKAAQDCGIKVVSIAINDPFHNGLNFAFKRILPAWEEAISFAERCGAGGILTFGGVRVSPTDEPKCIIIENLKRVAPIAAEHGLTVLMEPLNNVFEHQHIYLNNSALGFEVLKCVDQPNCRFICDLFHLQATEGNIVHNMVNNIEYVGHVHCAGFPGHDEPFRTELNVPYILNQLEAAGYDGFVAAEYSASYDGRQSIRDALHFLKSYRNLPVWEQRG